MNAAVVVILVIAIILLIVQVVLSALAASEVRKGQASTNTADQTAFFNRAHLYSTAAAVTAALCIVGLVIAMIVYINSQRILTAAHAKIGSMIDTHGAPQPVVNAVGEAVKAGN